MGVAYDFSKNLQEVMTPIMPANEGPVTAISSNVSAFSRAVNNQVQAPQITPVAANEGQRVANDAIGVGMQLQNPGQGIYLPPQGTQSMGAEFGGQMAKLGSEAGAAAYKLGGEAISAISSVFSLGDANGNGIPDDQEQNMQVAAPVPQTPQYNAGTSPGGPGGM